jgi:hypothetical protein
MQQQSPVSRRGRAAITLGMLSLGACVGPYGPAIPGAAAPYPLGDPSGAAYVTSEPVPHGPAAPLDVARADAPPAPRAAALPDAPASAPARVTRPAPRSPMALPTRFRSRQDSLAWVDAWRRARTDDGLRVVVSLDARTLWLLRGQDTLRLASVAIGTERRLVHGRQEWVFETPRGVRKVNAKAVDPVWTPPLWHYVEMAQIHGKKLVVMPRNGRVALPGGERLEVRDSLVGRWTPARGWTAWPVGDEIIIGASLYMPPVGTKNRVHHGQLGPFKLDVGDGYLIHGTPDASSIGRQTTHGCIRLADDDLAFLFEQVPVGTAVYIL